MKVAVTYENGEVFQHFGHSEAFKLYEVEGGEVKSSEVVPTNGSGHGALAGFLRGKRRRGSYLRRKRRRSAERTCRGWYQTVWRSFRFCG
mgnify:CR=1 FL=1